MAQDTENYAQLIAEYNEEYCASLEAVYGKGMMSEGQHESVQALIGNRQLDGQKVLDFGCGLGGVSFHLASEFNCHITGLDINPQMIARVKKRKEQLALTSRFLGLLQFTYYQDTHHLPFDDNSFDVILSKGVLTHVRYKQPLFQEFNRLLKPGGELIINDWLSPRTGHWGPKVQQLIEIEGLSLHALDLNDYQQLLQQAGFRLQELREDSKEYATFNRQIAQRLAMDESAKDFVEQFGEALRQDYMTSYTAIADAMSCGELLVKTMWLRKR